MKHFNLIILFLLFSTGAQAKNCDIQNQIRDAFIPYQRKPEIKIRSAKLVPLDRKLIDAVQDGKEYTYWVDDQNQLHFSPGLEEYHGPNTLTILSDPNHQQGRIIKESGLFLYDPRKKDFVFQAKNSIDLQPGEIDAILKKETKLNFERKFNPEIEKTRVIKCTEKMASELRGDSFIKDGVIVSGAVTLGSFVTMNPGVLNPNDPDWDQKARLLGSDLTANLVSSYVNGHIVKPLLAKDVGVLTDFVGRTTSDFASNIFVKRPIYNFINEGKIPFVSESDEKLENRSSIGNKLVAYDTGFSVVRFFPKRSIQRWSVNTLPKIMLASCMKNSKLSFVVGPRMVRIVDQYAWGLIYQGGRKLYLDQIEENKK